MSEPANSKNRVSRLSTHLIRNAVHLTVLAALAAGSAAAQAQTATATTTAAANTTEEVPLQEVIVTGTMIRRPNAETAEAVTILKSDALKQEGVTSVEEALKMLSSNTSQINTSSAVATFSGGG